MRNSLGIDRCNRSNKCLSRHFECIMIYALLMANILVHSCHHSNSALVFTRGALPPWIPSLAAPDPRQELEHGTWEEASAVERRERHRAKKIERWMKSESERGEKEKGGRQGGCQGGWERAESDEEKSTLPLPCRREPWRTYLFHFFILYFVCLMDGWIWGGRITPIPPPVCVNLY